MVIAAKGRLTARAVEKRTRNSGEQRCGQQQQRHSDPVDGQHGQRRQAQQRHDAAGDAGQDQAWRREFDVHTQRAQDQEYESDVGVGDFGHDSFAHAEAVVHDLGSASVQRFAAAVEAYDRAAIKLVEQSRLVGRHQVDQLFVERLLVRKSLGLTNGLLRQILIAAALLRSQAEVSFSIFERITGSICSPISTGEAAPVLVLGAMAAMSAASSRKNPAEAACPPLGVT
jgi:hypothetical protein